MKLLILALIQQVMHLTLKTTVSNSGFLLVELFQISLPIGVVKKTVEIVGIVEKAALN